jgi:hypothetical protein
MRIHFQFWIIVAAAISLAAGPIFAQNMMAEPCSQIAGMLVTEFTYQTPLSELPRVEIRQCGANSSETLQIVAWERGRSKPTLVLDTSDFSIAQSLARDNVFVIETSGGSRDQVYVIAFRGGMPVLELKRVTKGSANICINATSVDVEIYGIFAGDAPPRTETHKFPFK